MKIALHSVSYAGVWTGQIRLTIDQFLKKAADFGYDGVMLVAKRPHLSPLDADRATITRIRESLDQHGLEFVCMAGYTDFCAGTDHPDVPHREMQSGYVTELAKIAHDLGGS